MDDRQVHSGDRGNMVTSSHTRRSTTNSGPGIANSYVGCKRSKFRWMWTHVTKAPYFSPGVVVPELYFFDRVQLIMQRTFPLEQF